MRPAFEILGSRESACVLAGTVTSGLFGLRPWFYVSPARQEHGGAAPKWLLNAFSRLVSGAASPRVIGEYEKSIALHGNHVACDSALGSPAQTAPLTDLQRRQGASATRVNRTCTQELGTPYTVQFLNRRDWLHTQVRGLGQPSMGIPNHSGVVPPFIPHGVGGGFQVVLRRV